MMPMADDGSRGWSNYPYLIMAHSGFFTPRRDTERLPAWWDWEATHWTMGNDQSVDQLSGFGEGRPGIYVRESIYPPLCPSKDTFQSLGWLDVASNSSDLGTFTSQKESVDQIGFSHSSSTCAVKPPKLFVRARVSSTALPMVVTVPCFEGLESIDVRVGHGAARNTWWSFWMTIRTNGIRCCIPSRCLLDLCFGLPRLVVQVIGDSSRKKACIDYVPQVSESPVHDIWREICHFGVSRPSLGNQVYFPDVQKDSYWKSMCVIVCIVSRVVMGIVVDTVDTCLCGLFLFLLNVMVSYIPVFWPAKGSGKSAYNTP